MHLHGMPGSATTFPAMPRFLRFLAAFAGLCLLVCAPARATPALVVDADTLEVLLAEDAGRPWYPASTAKLMTALVTFEHIRAGGVGPTTPVVISKNAAAQKSVYSGLREGDAMQLEDALYAVIAGSANDVAVALAETVGGSEAAFVAMMNETAQRLGLTATRFTNPNGLFDSRQLSSARDLAMLAAHIERGFPEFREVFAFSRVVIGEQVLNSFNDLLTRYPGAEGMKTGFLCASGRNIVAVAERGGRRIMVVLLGATTDRERSERAAHLMTQAFNGTLRPSGQTLPALANDIAAAPEDMRLKLCSPQGAEYEKSREALYPWGLPGQASNLGAAIEPKTRHITIWAAGPRVPLPLPRPAGL